jgi:hypothetical protein
VIARIATRAAVSVLSSFSSPADVSGCGWAEMLLMVARGDRSPKYSTAR